MKHTQISKSMIMIVSGNKINQTLHEAHTNYLSMILIVSGNKINHTLHERCTH